MSGLSELSQIKPSILARPYIVSSYGLMRSLSMDTVGPFPKDDEENEYILVIIDCFSWYINIYPTKTVSAIEATDKLLDHTSIFRTPNEIQSDRGSQFVNELITELFRLIGTNHQLSVAYSKEENGIVERSNKEVLRHLRAIVMERDVLTHWAKYLPIVQRIINSNVHSSTGTTPSMMVFGDKLNLDRGFITPDTQPFPGNAKPKMVIGTWLANMQTAQVSIIRKAEEIQNALRASNLRKRSLNNNGDLRQEEEFTEFPINTHVLVAYNGGRMGRKGPTKLHSEWKGPMKVINHIGSTYTLLNLVNSKLEDHHITSLKKYIHDEHNPTPLQVAAKDKEEFIVDHIVTHRTNDCKAIKGWEFKVRWVGYESQQDDWLPYKNLRQNVFLHNYLRDKNMLTKIPKEFR